ncbi:MAG: trk/ktr system potassium uptake protein, partial [Solirubrobacteraceae bacterium]|nr:trk/ktr system potassium uptake protein [Solirubrobacteraceae bacterium]
RPPLRLRSGSRRPGRAITAEPLESRHVSFILIVGAGRVGSSVARAMLSAGHDVSILDEDPLSHERLDSGMDTTWEDAGGRFTLGHGLEIDALREAGIEEADVFIASTDGDNTNLTIAQIAAKAFQVPRVICRVMDPARAEWYAEQGLHTICPTSYAIEMFERALEEV